MQNLICKDVIAKKFIKYTTPNFIEACNVKACDKIYINNFIVFIICVIAQI